MTRIDPVELSVRLIRCPSVAPAEGGALKLLEATLTSGGFECHRVDRNGIANLFARRGPKGAARTFGFNGHTDVVPVGNADAWTHDPFGGQIVDGVLWGRGATDMKTGVAAFVAAAVDFAHGASLGDGAIILAITGDEEGIGADGTRALLDWMAAEGERMDVCLVGEPTCPERLGDMIKIGRRGALMARMTATGVQGHSAYPHRAKNPLTALVRLLDRLASHELDGGTAHFDPSTLAITTIDTGNVADNVIPARAVAKVNIRYNDAHSSSSLDAWLRGEAARVTAEIGVSFDIVLDVWGESFITQPGPLVELVVGAVKAKTGLSPELSTTGGTSDARFIRAHCPVVEFGLVGKTMHQVDERIEVDQIVGLTAIYGRILRDYFGKAAPNEAQSP
jgi:succinyl-diaminopimelate desuccinylase